MEMHPKYRRVTNKSCRYVQCEVFRKELWRNAQYTNSAVILSPTDKSSPIAANPKDGLKAPKIRTIRPLIFI